MAEPHDPVGSRLAGSTWRPTPGPYETPLESPSRTHDGKETPTSLMGKGPTPNSLTEPARAVRFSRAEHKAPTAPYNPVPVQRGTGEYCTPPEAAAVDGRAGYGTPSSLETSRSVRWARAEYKAPNSLEPVAELADERGGYERAAHDPPDSLQNSLEGEGSGVGRRMQSALESHRETKRSYADRYRDVQRGREGPRGAGNGRRGPGGAFEEEFDRHREIRGALDMDARRRNRSRERAAGRHERDDDEIGVSVDDVATEMTPLERWESRKERKRRERGLEYTRPSPDPRGPRAVTPTREGRLDGRVAEVARDRSTRWSPREEDGYEEEVYDEEGREEHDRAASQGRRGDDRPDPLGHRQSSMYEKGERDADRRGSYRVGSDDAIGGSPLYDDVGEEGAGIDNVGNRSPLSIEEHFEERRETPQRSARPPPPPPRSTMRRPPPPPRSALRSSTNSRGGTSTYADDLRSFTESVTGEIVARNGPNRDVHAAHSPGSDRDESTVRSHNGREYNEMERGTNREASIPEMAVPVSPHDSAATSRDHFSLDEDVRVRHRASDFCGRFTSSRGLGCHERSGSGDKSRRKYLCITFVVCAACIIATALGIYYLSEKKNEEDIGRFGIDDEDGVGGGAMQTPTAAPSDSSTEDPTQRPTERPTGEREKTIGDFLYHLSSGQSERRGTAQHEAKLWILHEDELNLHLPHSVEGPHGSYGQGSGRGDWESSVARRIKQRYALATLYYAMGIGDGGSAKGWLQGDECRFAGDYGTAWDGIGCHEDGMVRALVLDGANLHGSIPHEISLLGSVENLIIKNNPGLVGTIPANLGSHLSQLRQLGLYNNHLTGSIPKNIFKLSHLVYLNLADNSFAGQVHWQEIGNHQKKLQRLILHNNALEGPVDFHLLARATSLVLMALSNNSFHGNVDDTVGSLINLEYLYLDGNDLDGSIPDGITSLTKLKALNLDENGLYGTLPRALGDLSSLTYLSAKGNTLSGGLPDSMKNMTLCKTLNLASNAMSGNLRGLSSMRGLRNVHLYQNSFSGPIDGSLFTNLAQLEVLFLSSNSLTGGIPSEIAHAQRTLKGLYLSDNRLVGGVNRELCALYKTENLYLDTNAFEGPLPSCLGNLSALRRFHAFGNRLNGDVPSGLINLPHLIELGIEENDISAVVDEDNAATCERVREKGLAIWADCDEMNGGCDCCERCCSDESNDC